MTESIEKTMLKPNRKSVRDLIRKVRVLRPDKPNFAFGIFNESSSGFLNWNKIPYSQMYPIFKKLLGNFWQASDINMTDDVKQWDSGIISDKEKDPFLYVNTQLAALDSLQAPSIIKLQDYISEASIKHPLIIVAQQEVIHTEAYPYMLSSLIPSEEQEFRYEQARKDPFLLKRNMFVLETYNEFIDNPTIENTLHFIIKSMILEGIFFYSGFAFFYALGKEGKMMKAVTMIEYIQRDETQHASLIAQIFKIVLGEYPEYNTEELVRYAHDAFKEAVQLETEWAHRIFTDELQDLLNVNMNQFDKYLQFLGDKRLGQLGIDPYFSISTNPMKWINIYSDKAEANTKTDFFEQRSRQYAKVSVKNGFDEL